MPINSNELILAQDVPLQNYLPTTGGTLTGNLSVPTPMVIKNPNGNNLFLYANPQWSTLGHSIPNQGLQSQIMLKADNTIAVASNANLDPARITNLSDPIDNNDAATKEYVDNHSNNFSTQIILNNTIDISGTLSQSKFIQVANHSSFNFNNITGLIYTEIIPNFTFETTVSAGELQIRIQNSTSTNFSSTIARIYTNAANEIRHIDQSCTIYPLFAANGMINRSSSISKEFVLIDRGISNGPYINFYSKNTANNNFYLSFIPVTNNISYILNGTVQVKMYGIKLK